MKPFERTVAGVLPAAFLSILAGGCFVGIVDLDEADASWDKEATRLLTATVPVSSQIGVHVTGVNGELRVLGVAGSQEVAVRAIKRVRSSSTADAEAHLSDIHVQIRSGAEEIRIETVQPERSGHRDYIVDYEITVPEHFHVTGINANGALFLEGVQADLVVDAGNGNVTIREVEGGAWISVGNGTVDASLVLPDGDQMVCAIGNGSMRLTVQREVSAELKARVGNGTISVSGLILVNPVSGPHMFHSQLGSGAGLIDLSVGNGTIQVWGV